MTILSVENLKTCYFTLRGPVKAVDGVTLEVERGGILGLVGESGCGKSTLGYSILRIVPYPGKIVSGRIYFNGEDLVAKNEEQMRKIRWRKISMIFQGAMNALNPIIKAGDQVAEAIMAHERVTKEQAMGRVKELFELVGLDPDRMNDYPFEFSGGMKQRAMIAMALACNPEFVIADEPTTALDVTIQAQIIELLKSLVEKLKLSLMVITHDLGVVAEICDRVAVMYAGKLVEAGDIITIFKAPKHPYTKGLIAAIPTIEEAGRGRLVAISGNPPDLLRPPLGCRFHPRCELAQDICRRSEPPLVEVGKGHLVACHAIGG